MLLESNVTVAEKKALSRFLEREQQEALDECATVINLPQVIVDAGFHRIRTRFFSTDLVPKLAVARPNWESTMYDADDGSATFGDVRGIDIRHTALRQTSHVYRHGMPPIPIEGRRVMIGSERQYAVLFEANNWTQLRGEQRPALDDPAILRHIVGALWGVLYTWDLTPVEKRALGKLTGV